MINLFLTYSVFWGVEKIADLEGFVQCYCGLPVIRQTLLEKYNELANLTTPDPSELYRILSVMAEKGCEYVVMETSSHALDQKRLAGCRFAVGVFTNLTQDHLDYHVTMEN